MITNYSQLLDEGLPKAHESIETASIQHENYQNVKRKNGGIIARGKATPEQLKDAHDEQEQAKFSSIKSQKEALRRNTATQEAALMALPRTFAGAYQVLSAVASTSLAAMVDDMAPYDKEFGNEIRSYESVSMELGSQQAFNGAVAELIEHEKQYQVILTSLVFFRKQLVSAAGSIKVPESTLNSIFNQVDFLEANENAFVDKIVAASKVAPAAKSVAGALGECVRSTVGATGKLYVPYLEQLSRVLEEFEHVKVKSKGFCAKLKEFERECALTGMTSFQFNTMISAPAKHLHSLLGDLKEVLNNTSPTGDQAGWASLHEGCEKLTKVLQRVDEAKKYSDRIKKLIKLKELLPDVDDLVDGTRDFIHDCDVSIAAVTLGDFGGSDDFASSAPTPSPSLQSPAGGSSGSGGSTADSNNPVASLKAGQTYGFYLFSDVAIFMYKKHAVARINIKDMTASPVGKEKGGKYSIAVTVFRNIGINGAAPAQASKPNTFKLIIGSEAAYNQLSFNLQEAIIKRSKTQIMGVALETVMARPPERGRAVPKIFESIAQYIRENCATDDAEGVFRLSGSSSAVASYLARINAGMRVRFDDVISAGAIFKAILRSMPKPLLTAELYDSWMKYREDPDKMKTECLPKLPQYNRFLLYMIVDLCCDVSKHAELNKMTMENLSIVFAPNILYKNKNSNDPAAINQSNIAVSTLINNAKSIFENVATEIEAMKKSATDAKIKASNTKLERNIQRATLRRSAMVENFDYDEAQAAADAAAANAAAGTPPALHRTATAPVGGVGGAGAGAGARPRPLSGTAQGVVSTSPGVKRFSKGNPLAKTMPGKSRPGSGFIGVRTKTLPSKPSEVEGEK